jgi:hypothetical protein
LSSSTSTTFTSASRGSLLMVRVIIVVVVVVAVAVAHVANCAELRLFCEQGADVIISIFGEFCQCSTTKMAMFLETLL